MFTGIITHTGKVVRLQKAGAGARLVISVDWDQQDIAIGESIAVSGCCLTVVKYGPSFFEADLSGETLRLTTFAHIRVGARVNLERALRLSDRLGGHWVTGHVDQVGQIVGRRILEGSVELSLEVSESSARYLVNKGSVTVDGISLTVSLSNEKSTADRSGRFQVYIIPHTLSETTLSTARVGDRVNIELDYLAKLVERLSPSATEKDDGN